MPKWNDVLSIGPGPAGYLPASTNNGPRFTIQRRYTSSAVEVSPGPADYTPVRRSASPSFSIQRRTTRSKSPSTPGPADYSGNPLALRPRSPTFRFSTQPRRARSALERSPGPSDYQIPDLSVTRRSSRASSLSGRPQSHSTPSTPGPATYNANASTFWPRVHGGTIGIRHSFNPLVGLVSSSTRTPGPADYTPTLPAQWRTSTGFSLSGRHTNKITESLGPGPAGYYPKQIRRAAPAFSMPHSARTSSTVCMGLQTSSPGPADYNADNPLLVSRRAPAFSLSGRHYIYRNEIT